jgi:hypothetical protein
VPPIVVPDQCFEWRDFLDWEGNDGEVRMRDEKGGRAREQDINTAMIDWHVVAVA